MIKRSSSSKERGCLNGLGGFQQNGRGLAWNITNPVFFELGHLKYNESK